MVWIQQCGKMFDRNHKETFRMRAWCSGEVNREKTLTCRQTKNTMSINRPEPVSHSCEEKAQSEIMKIE